MNAPEGFFKLRPEVVATTAHAATVKIYDFVQGRLSKLLNVLLSSPRDNAVTGVFLRMSAWMYSLKILGPEAFNHQAAAAAIRGLYELLADLEVIAADKTGVEAEKCHAFTEVERLKRASAFVNWRDQNPDPTGFQGAEEHKFIAREGARINGLAQKFWGVHTGGPNKGMPIHPQHWTGTSKMKDRAKDLDDMLGGHKYSEDYHYLYYMTSWHMHSGLVGAGGIPEEGLWRFMSLYHSWAHRLYLDGVLLVARALKLELILQGTKIGGFREEIEKLRVEADSKLTKLINSMPPTNGR